MKQKQSIAIVGMAGVFPGAPDLDTFWQNMVNKINSTEEVPHDRWIVPPEAMYDPIPKPDKAFSTRACLIREFAFDPEGIRLGSELLGELDPLYHLVLHAGRDAWADCVTASLDKTRVGVILAAIALPTDASSAITREILGNLEAESSKPCPRPFLSGIKARISREQALGSRVTSFPGAILAKGLGLGGGSLTLDAACASSLYAVKLACDELHAHRADAMLAGGVSRPECLYTQVGFSQLRALSPSGACSPFDENADGLVVGEGVGIVVLKRLADALRDGDTIYGLIRGVGLSNDMRGNLLAPETRGQVRAMKDAYESAGWSPFDIDLIECHGAGTPVGDATELHSLRTLWEDFGWSPDHPGLPPGRCAIGSVKSMIGHLLTGAGAAGLIKILLGLNHKILPPSLNFHQAPEGSPLNHGPFRVQTEPEPWRKRDAETPRRAAVSAFGFGGINAHLLIEECPLKKEDDSSAIPSSLTLSHPPPIAIVGMDAVFGELKSLRDFQETVFRGESAIRKRPATRWKGADDIADHYLSGAGVYGGYMKDISVCIGEFHIPPNEIPDILPQQLLMLKVSAQAMQDAGLPLRKERPRMGVIIGIEFDFEATNFHLRWNLYNDVQTWRTEFGLDDGQAAIRLESLRDACGPPLTPARTVGALGGIVASRIAREFRFGGPSFVVSAESASGISALEIGVRSLQQHETDAILVAAVDLAGDIRNVITTSYSRAFSKTKTVHPLDPSADGTLPGEGAAALVLKRLDDAVQGGDRIYAVVKGIGKASGSGTEACILSLDRAFRDAELPSESVSYVEINGSGDPLEDRTESDALREFFRSKTDHSDQIAKSDLPDVAEQKGEGAEESEAFRAIGTLKPIIGHTGASAGLAAVVKTALCLYHEIVPPASPLPLAPCPLPLCHLPAYAQFWFRDQEEGPRRACVGSMTTDENCSHVILEGVDYPSVEQIPERVERERRRPLGFPPFGLFVIEGDTKADLLKGLETLQASIADPERPIDLVAREFCDAVRTTPLTTDPERPIDLVAREWHLKNRTGHRRKYAVSIVAGDISRLQTRISEAMNAVSSDTHRRMADLSSVKGKPPSEGGQGGVSHSPHPFGGSGEIAFVFPGSGNHYVGMGRGVGVYWPEVLREMDAETSRLKTQMIPECYVPWRSSWEPGWEQDAHEKIVSDPLHMIFGQVVHGGMMTRLVRRFLVEPDAVIGYSLGESAGLFATGAWPERGEMLKRMLETNLFSTELAGPCHAARNAWDIPVDEAVGWRVAVVNRPGDEVRKVIEKRPFARLLIVNTPEECVIGGREDQVQGVIKALGCEAVFLEGVVTVHCDAALPVADAYKALHIFPTTPIPRIRFYSCAMGRSYELTSENAASSILQQAVSGFDFTATIQQAYADGVRIFLEMGPQASCTRMIRRILHQTPHLAVSADVRGEDDYLTILKFLGDLSAERVPVNLDPLYGDDAYPPTLIAPQKAASKKEITIPIGGVRGRGLGVRGWGATGNGQPTIHNGQRATDNPQSTTGNGQPTIHNGQRATGNPPSTTGNGQRAGGHGQPTIHNGQRATDNGQSPTSNLQPTFSPFSGLIEPATKAMEATSDAHRMFLDFSSELTQNFGKTFAFQTQLIGAMGERRAARDSDHQISEMKGDPIAHSLSPLAFDREMCMEFAIGSLGKVLGPAFAVVDTYNVRVRLPDEPLMLVDRIISVEGGKGSLGSGRVVTAHDVLPGAWYLDGDRAPVCISVEAGQADLFLCSYLGIDLAVKGKRAYRLLDATVKFHRGLPRPGDVIRYEIEIEKFVRQGEVHLFFFRFEGFIGDEHLITMRDGCAGFFTEEETRHSGGIILIPEDTQLVPGRSEFTELVPLYAESYDDEAIESLRHGDLAGCFGDLFDGVPLAESLWLPSGRMKLIHRVPLLDPEGGRYGLGIIRGEADIHPNDWFLTCHFMDDMVMPGTLMYECCAHTLRVLLFRMGWVTEKPGVCCEPVIGVESVLKCRGPVTPATKQVLYEVEISEVGYSPEPYVIADALMYGDGHKIVRFKEMSMKMTGLTRDEVEAFWQGVRGEGRGAIRQGARGKGRGVAVRQGARGEGRGAVRQGARGEGRGAVRQGARGKGREVVPLFDRERILAFAIGKPSEAFGEPYKVFDQKRKIARLPRPPYAFMDRVTSIEPAPWVLKPDGWIEAEYDMPADEWYFRADRSGAMPFCVLLEIALQPCGWLAAFVGSALRSEDDLKFRNLGGQAVLHRNIQPESATLTMRSRLTQVSESGGMIIENFDMQVLQAGEMIYEGNTYFGFFSKAALAQQVGIRGAREKACTPSPDDLARSRSHRFKDEAPLFPDDLETDMKLGLTMPAKALRMIDEIEIYVPDGGPHGLGFIRGVKIVDPDEWFFKAHFYQDPVCPGSLGIESFLQLMKFVAMDRWKDLTDRCRFEMVTNRPHQWIYRGQVIQKNRRVEVDAVVTEVCEEPIPMIFANGYLKVDGLFIYEMKDFGLRLLE